MKIVLLYGGLSKEREVSIDTAKSIYKSVKDDCLVEMVDFNGNYDRLLDQLNSSNPTLVFNALHGGDGENGTIQKFLDINKFNYTGSDEAASRIAMDKHQSKIICKNHEIPTPDWDYLDLSKDKITSNTIRKIMNDYKNTGCVVKPSVEGSSIGMTIINKEVFDSKTILNAINDCMQFSEKIIVERFIKGREITCGILDDEALPLVEIVPNHDFYDYKCKYTKGMSEYISPPDIAKEISDTIKKYSKEIFSLIGCRHYSRIDFRLDEDNVYFLEINTLPGMTDTSLLPKAALRNNINYKQLVKKIINLSIQC